MSKTKKTTKKKLFKITYSLEQIRECLIRAKDKKEAAEIFEDEDNWEADDLGSHSDSSIIEINEVES
jgi:hypothetical protein